MKKIFAVTMVFGLAVSFVGCGTEDDPTLGIDNQDMTDEAALINGKCEVDYNTGVLTGKCLVPVTCFKSTATVAACPVGATPKKLQGNLCRDLVSPGRYDYMRSCAW